MFRGNKTENDTQVIDVEQGDKSRETNSPLTPAYIQPRTETGPQPAFETDKRNQLRGEIDLLRGYLEGNPSIPSKTRASIIERLAKLDEHVGSSWMSSTSSNQFNNILGKTPELSGFQQNLGSVEGLISGIEQKEKSGQPITDADVSALAQNAAELIQTYPQFRDEEPTKATKHKENTLFKVFKTVTGVKSEEDYSDLSEKDQAKVLQKEALKHLTLFERIFLSIGVNFLHKGDPEWLKDHLFKKIKIPYLAKVEILKFFYPDRDPNTLREVEKEKVVAPPSKKIEREDSIKPDSRKTLITTAPLPLTKESPTEPDRSAIQERPITRQPERSRSIPVIPKEENKPRAEEERQIRHAENLSKTRSLEQLIENRTDKEKLDIFGESLLGDVVETSERINELMLEDLKKYDIPVRLNGLTNQVNKLIYECGIIPSEEEIDHVFEQIRNSETFKPSDRLQSDIVESSIKQMIHIRTGENQLMNIWINEAVEAAKSKDGKEVVNGGLVEQIFTQKLIDHIIDYRTNLPEGQKGRIETLQEAEVLKKEFAKSIQDHTINVEFYQVGQIHVPVLMIDDYEKQASLYGSNNPKDRDKVSPGRFFFDGTLQENLQGIEVPSLVSTVSFVTKDYLEHPELLKHEIIHATHELQQHAQREIFRESYQQKTLKSNLVGESLIKFILSGDTKIQIQTLRDNNIEILDQTLLLADEIKAQYSQEEINYFITGGYQLGEDGEFSKVEVPNEIAEKAKSLRQTLKDVPTEISGREFRTVNATEISADLMQEYIETGTSGIPEFDQFIQENYQLNNHTTKIGEVYNRFYNPINEAVTTYVSSDRNVSLGELKIPNLDKDNPELIGGLALVRLLNEHNRSRVDMTSHENIENFVKEKELLATYLNSSPLYKNGRVTIGSMMEILSNSLEDENDPIHELLNVIIPNQENGIDEDYLSKLRETIPLLDRWLGDNDITEEQYRIIKFLFPMSLLIDFDKTLEIESEIKQEDNGIGKAINPDPLLRHAVTNTYVAAEFGPNVSPNSRSGQTYGGKTDYFTRPFMPKDPGNQLLQFWGWNSKTFTDGFGIGASKKFRLDSIDPLEAIAFATGLPIHRLPFLENLREKMLTQDAYYPDTYVSPSPRAYTAGTFKEIFGSIQRFGRLDDMSAITLMTKIGGYNFNLQGQPTLSNETWIHEDEYRNNDALAEFISGRVPQMESKLRADYIEADGNVIDVGKFKVGQISKGYLKDILESMVMGSYPSGNEPINKWGHAMMGYEKSRKTMDGNLRKRSAFERIGKIMMAADYARNVEVVTHEDGTTTEEYTGKKAYTLFDLYEAINTAQLEMPESIYFNSSGQKRSPDEVAELEKTYMKQDFTIKINGVNVGEGITGPKDKGVITLKDAKEFLEFAIIARAERVANVGVWGKAETRDPNFNRIPVPINSQRDLEDFININGYVVVDNFHLSRGGELYEIIQNPQNQTAELCRVTEAYSEDAEIKTGAKVYGNVDLKMKHIENFSPEQMLFFFGKKEAYTTTDADGVVHNIEARRGYKLNEGLIYDSAFDELEKINQGKKLSFQFSMKLLQTDRYREFSKAQMEFWNGIRNIDSFYRFVIIAASAVGALVPGMAFLANPGLFVGLMAWSLIASPLINRQANGWQAKMMASIEAQGDILGYADRFNNLANEEHPPSFGDLDLARTQMETVKFKWRTVLANMSKNAKWDTNVFTNIFNQMWGKVT